MFFKGLPEWVLWLRHLRFLGPYQVIVSSVLIMLGLDMNQWLTWFSHQGASMI